MTKPRLLPLYRYDQELGQVSKRENLKPEFRQWLKERYKKNLTPEQILAFIYAVLHSPHYRQKYRDFLRIDFPRIPFPATLAEFKQFAKIGTQLINLHLLKDTALNQTALNKIKLHGDHDKPIERVRHEDDKLHINPTTYFEGITSDVFQFRIGGYLPLDKYLKSRKGRTLTLDDIETIKKAATAIKQTLTLMEKITHLPEL